MFNLKEQENFISEKKSLWHRKTKKHKSNFKILWMSSSTDAEPNHLNYSLSTGVPLR